ncbi:MAG: hypothetical protein EBU90_27365 [Proteobacteria bacterium]|nr:hypothetical protein [Pseudomonadota bacterium]
MTLPLRPDDLEVGKLYKGIWLNPINEAMTSHLMIFTPERVSSSERILSSIECFVLLEKEQDPTEMTWCCKLLTSNGDIGWTYFSTGTHWFKELTENNT